MNQKYTEILKTIESLESIILNANDQEQNIWDSFPSLEIEVESDWSDEHGFIFNVSCKDIKDPEDDSDNLEREETEQVLESAINAKVDTYCFYVAKCSCETNSRHLSVKSQSDEHFYKNNTNYCTTCGYPKGVYSYTVIDSCSKAEKVLANESIEKSEENVSLLKKCYSL
jgi:hypothetical protein